MNPRHPVRGSIILIVLIFTTIIGILAGSLLAYSISERRLNQRTQLRYESKNAAEAVLEYGAAELVVRFRSDLNFATDQLKSTPVATHTGRAATLFANPAGQLWTNVDPASVNLWVSQTSESGRRYVDPNNPENDFDPLRGQNVSVQAVRLLARASATHVGGITATTHATQLFEIREAALFNYAIFYNIDMEFHPGPTMSVYGPVHSNRPMYLTTNANLAFHSTVTTAGNLTLGDKGVGRTIAYNIAFTNGTNLVTANNPTVGGSAVGSYVDSQLVSRVPSKNFHDIASQAWRGYVQDSSHGISPQTPPGVTTPEQARQLILPPATGGSTTIESQKYSNKAGLYMVVEPTGEVVNFKNPADATTYKAVAAGSRAAWRAANPDKIVVPPVGMINNQRRMYDHREGKWINTIDINLGVMRTAVNTSTAGAASNFKVNGADWSIDAADGWNGIVYVDIENPLTGFTSTSDVGTMGTGSGGRTAVRLVNGSQLPNRAAVNSARPEGLTVATNSTAYITGHFNADGSLAADMSDTSVPEAGEVPAAVVADAINILSQAWWDSGTGKPTGDSTSNNTSRPAAAHTEVSAAFITGIVESPMGGGASQYSGGVENYPRFHENWGSKNFRYRGSMVALFASSVGTGKWSSAKYGAPNRQWGHNALFASGRYPPGTPRLRTYRRLDYRDLTPAEFNTLLADTRLEFIAME
jgi:Tfp pilus assembly protein PilX